MKKHRTLTELKLDHYERKLATLERETARRVSVLLDMLKEYRDHYKDPSTPWIEKEDTEAFHAYVDAALTGKLQWHRTFPRLQQRRVIEFNRMREGNRYGY